MGALLVTACATSRDTLAGPRPARVAVLVSSEVPQPPPQNAIDDLTGAESPAALIAREAARTLKSRGYRPAVVEAAPPGVAAAQVARDTGNDAALLVRLERLELGSLRTLGRAEVHLEAQLVAADGTLLWSGVHRGPTRVSTYRSTNDWRSHVRAALEDALGPLP